VAGTDLDLARADCDAALALSTEASTLDSRGLVGLKQGDFDKAWDDYDAALQAGPSASYLYGRGYAALRLGRKADGAADIAAAVELDAGIAEEYARYGVPPP
jgi:lipoprotein NlpI